jgi:hypothetical protein
MHSPNLDTDIPAEPVEPQTMPAQGANALPSDSTTEDTDVDDPLDHKPVPPRLTVTISVQYRHLGRGRPLPYLLEDGEE